MGCDPHPGAVLGIFIWVGRLKAKQILGRPTGVVYVGIMGMTRAVWVGHGLPGLIARTASVRTAFYSICLSAYCRFVCVCFSQQVLLL